MCFQSKLKFTFFNSYRFKDWKNLKLLQNKDPSTGSYQRACKTLKGICEKLEKLYPDLKTTSDYKVKVDIIGRHFDCNVIVLETLMEAKVVHTYPENNLNPCFPMVYVHREVLLCNKESRNGHMNYVNSYSEFSRSEILLNHSFLK